MTRLEKDVTRLAEAAGIVVTMTPAGLVLRRHGRRTAYGPVSWGQLLIYAARLEADRARAENRKPKRGKALKVGI